MNLRVLKIEDNLLTDVPALDTLIELNEVSLSSNQIKMFPVSINSYTHTFFFDLFRELPGKAGETAIY